MPIELGSSMLRCTTQAFTARARMPAWFVLGSLEQMVVLPRLREDRQPGGVPGVQGRRGLRQAPQVRWSRLRARVAHVSGGGGVVRDGAVVVVEVRYWSWRWR